MATIDPTFYDFDPDADTDEANDPPLTGEPAVYCINYDEDDFATCPTCGEDALCDCNHSEADMPSQFVSSSDYFQRLLDAVARPQPMFKDKPTFRVYSCMPKYDERDGICGTRYIFQEMHFTKAWALVRCARLNAELGGDDYRFIVKDDRNREVLDTYWGKLPHNTDDCVPTASANDLPF